MIFDDYTIAVVADIDCENECDPMLHTIRALPVLRFSSLTDRQTIQAKNLTKGVSASPVLVMQPGCDDHDGFQPGLYPVRNVTNIVKVLHVSLRQKKDFSYLCLIQIDSAEDIQPINKAPFQKNLNELYRKKLPMINRAVRKVAQNTVRT